MKKAAVGVVISVLLLVFGTQLTYADDEGWKNNWLYVGARLGGSVKFYDPSSYELDKFVSFEPVLYGSVQLFENLALQVELIYTGDDYLTKVFYSDNYTSSGRVYSISYTVEEKMKFNSLMIPILAKFTHRQNLLYFAGLTGFYFTLPLGEMEESIKYSDVSATINSIPVDVRSPDNSSHDLKFTGSPGFIIGGNVGIKIGPGVVLFDLRYSKDFDKIRMEYENRNYSVFKRSQLSFTFGYEIGIIGKK